MNIGRKFHKYFVSLSIGHIPYPRKTKKRSSRQHCNSHVCISNIKGITKRTEQLKETKYRTNKSSFFTQKKNSSTSVLLNVTKSLWHLVVEITKIQYLFTVFVFS